MMNCKQATRMLSEKLDRPLSSKEKIALGVHTTICVSCRRFSHQIEKIRSISKCYVKESESK